MASFVGLGLNELVVHSVFLINYFNLLFFFVSLFFVTFFVYLITLDFCITCDLCLPFGDYLLAFDFSYCAFCTPYFTAFVHVIFVLRILFITSRSASSFVVASLVEFNALYLVMCNRFLYTLLASYITFYRFLHFDLYFLFLFYYLFVFVNVFAFLLLDLFLFFVYLDFFGLFIDLLLADSHYYNSHSYLSTFLCY